MNKIAFTAAFAALTALFAASAQADIIKCSFTEPFVGTTYSMAQQSLTYEAFTGDDPLIITVVNNVSMQIKGPGRFDLVGADGKVLQELNLNSAGSDGMSDRTYPYEVKDNSMVTGANGGIGGCTSNYLQATEPQDGN